MIGYLIAGAAAWLLLKGQTTPNTSTTVSPNANATGTAPLTTVATAKNVPVTGFAVMDPTVYSGVGQMPPGVVIQNAHPMSGVVYPWSAIPRTDMLTGRSPSPFAVAPGQPNPLAQGNDPTADPWLPPTKITIETQQAGAIDRSRFGTRQKLPVGELGAPGAPVTTPVFGPGGAVINPPSPTRPVSGVRVVGPVSIPAPVRAPVRGIVPVKAVAPVSGRPTAQGIPPSKLATLYGSSGASFDLGGVFSHGSLVG